MLNTAAIRPVPSPDAPYCLDDTYRELLGRTAWQKLKPEIRRRFSVKPAPGTAIRYRGCMFDVRMSFMGNLFAQACRLIGSPLALTQGRDVPMDIELVPDDRFGGVRWRRTYHFSPGGDFTVCSTKSLNSAGQLVEHIGCGFSMRLRLLENSGDLIFVSEAYEFTLFGVTVRIPDWLTPGVTTVTHEQIAGDRFRFSLLVDHPQLGPTVYQEGEFYSA